MNVGNKRGGGGHSPETTAMAKPSAMLLYSGNFDSYPSEGSSILLINSSQALKPELMSNMLRDVLPPF